MREYVPEEPCLHTQECAILRKRGDFRSTKKEFVHSEKKKYGGDSGAGTTMFAKALPFRKKSDVLLKRVYKEMLSVKYV